ncbi:hypothetical protein [Salinigranum rubrum]|uniref:hypothetical protein n=1 Tax=Salinigranum rubrum TaxID=755307 RepID=UPI0013A5823C|nr:hypothetical protein [Salinigranum rubrum]
MAFDRRKIIKSVFGGVILISTGCLDRMSAFNDANSTPEYQSNPPTQGDAQNETITANVEAKQKYSDTSGSQTTVIGFRRIPSANSTNSDEFTYIYDSFEQWAETECPRFVSDYLKSILDSRINSSTKGIQVGINNNADSWSITVNYIILLNQSGKVIAEPEVKFHEVVENTPRSIRATLKYNGKKYTCEYDINVVEDTRRET